MKKPSSLNSSLTRLNSYRKSDTLTKYEVFLQGFQGSGVTHDPYVDPLGLTLTPLPKIEVSATGPNIGKECD